MLNKLFKAPTQPRIKGLQLEVSTICQLSCLYCPRTNARDWSNMVMPWDMYENCIAPYFYLFDMVYLQGWGEPLTNPNFWRMVKLAKADRREVGFTTNGILLDEQAMERIFDLEVDLISFTLTGSNAATHEFYRRGSSYDALINTIHVLIQKKRSLSKKKPLIGVHFTMMRDNLNEFSDAAKLVLALGCDQVTASHMDCIPELDMERHAVFLYPKPDDEEYIRKAAHIVQSSRAFFKAEPPHLCGEILVCEPNPLRTTLFVRADGTVVPCHQMALPPKIIHQLYFHGSEYQYTPLTLGNVRSEKLSDILNNDASMKLRNTFGLRQDGIGVAGQSIPDAPLLCQKCYKLYGV